MPAMLNTPSMTWSFSIREAQGGQAGTRRWPSCRYPASAGGSPLNSNEPSGMDRGPPVGHFHVGDGVLDKAIEARHRPAGVDKIVAAACRSWWPVIRTITRHRRYSLPEVTWTVLCGHLDLVEDGETAVSNPTTAPATNLFAAVEPSARLAELAEYLLNLLVRTLGPAGGRPLDYGLGIGYRPAQQIGGFRRRNDVCSGCSCQTAAPALLTFGLGRFSLCTARTPLA